ncbi:MAG: glycosyltransferase family 39 protein, partial [Anaerolineales bacterium]|nr:glycosyltransferase family 39 protein [Anaerolineales bacterium]
MIAFTAIALRVYAIDRLPPGLFGDEAVEGLDALDVLAGNWQIWFHAHLGREPIYVYLTALSYALFGVTAFATRLPALIAGLLTIPAAFFFTREWASEIFPRERATRLAFLTSALLAISFWHVQMTRNAHRDTLLPLVEAVGYFLLWRAFRTRDWRFYASAGAVLGLAIYTYSPGRFVGVFVGLFVAVEFVIWWVADRRRTTGDRKFLSPVIGHRSSVIGLALAALGALIVMAPLAIYFAQNPTQFVRRFDSTSIFDQANPVALFATSVAGNLAQFIVPEMGYQSKHYNLPGKPIFDLFIAPWFLIGVVIALTRWRQSQYRFLLLWFIVMCLPAFLTADMIPKGVRVLGVAPGVFIFPALAMDWASEKSKVKSQKWIPLFTFYFLLLTFVGSAIWTTYDYFVAWAHHPEVPLKF